MSNTKYTPAPWEFKGGIIVCSDGQILHNEYRTHDEQEANAKLIAAAPELLDALLAMDELDKCEHLSDKWWKQAEKANELREAAIKKATQ